MWLQRATLTLTVCCCSVAFLQDRAPHQLFNKAGELRLSWVSGAAEPRFLDAMGMTRPEYNTFVREWPHSEEGRRLLQGLRWAVGAGWLLPLAAFSRRLMLVGPCKSGMAYLHGLTQMPHAAA